MKTLTAIFALLSITATAGVAQTSQSMDHSTMQTADSHLEGAVPAKAVIHSMGAGVANVSHDPVPEIGWPAMTMDLTVLEDARMMGEVSAGDDVTLLLVKGDDGMYAIGAIMPN